MPRPHELVASTLTPVPLTSEAGLVRTVLGRLGRCEFDNPEFPFNINDWTNSTNGIVDKIDVTAVGLRYKVNANNPAVTGLRYALVAARGRSLVQAVLRVEGAPPGSSNIQPGVFAHGDSTAFTTMVRKAHSVRRSPLGGEQNITQSRTSGGNSAVADEPIADRFEGIDYRSTIFVDAANYRGYDHTLGIEHSLTHTPVTGTVGVALYTFANAPQIVQCRRFFVMAGRTVVVSGLVTGASAEVCLSDGTVIASAAEAGGVATVTLPMSLVYPGPAIVRIRSSGGSLLAELTPAEGVWGGDTYSFEAGITSAWSRCLPAPPASVFDPCLLPGEVSTPDWEEIGWPSPFPPSGIGLSGEWVSVAEPVAVVFSDVMWSSALGMFLAIAEGLVGENRRVFSSADGIAWALRATVPADCLLEWKCIARGAAGVLAALSGNSSGDERRIMTSTDDGVTWAKLAQTTSSTRWRRLIWIEAWNLFFGIGDGGAIPPIQRFIRSPDGTNGSWISFASPGTQTGNLSIRCIAFSPSLGRLLVIFTNDGTGLVGSVAYSDASPGTVWTFLAGELTPSAGTWEGLVWVPDFGGRFVAVGNNGNIATSPTGATGTWTKRTSPAPLGTAALVDVVYVPEDERLIAIINGDNRVLVSDDGGETWTIQNAITAHGWTRIAYAAALRRAVKVSGSGVNRIEYTPPAS